MEGAQPLVDPSLVGSFAFFSSSSWRNFDLIFFPGFFSSLKQPKSSFIFFEFVGRLKEEKT